MASGLRHGDQSCRWWPEHNGQLPTVVLSPAIQDWLTGLSEDSINFWGDLCAKFINNFQETFTKPGVEWDLYQIQKKKGESLREFIWWFIKKKNSISSIS